MEEDMETQVATKVVTKTKVAIISLMIGSLAIAGLGIGKIVQDSIKLKGTLAPGQVKKEEPHPFGTLKIEIFENFDFFREETIILIDGFAGEGADFLALKAGIIDKVDLAGVDINILLDGFTGGDADFLILKTKILENLDLLKKGTQIILDGFAGGNAKFLILKTKILENLDLLIGDTQIILDGFAGGGIQEPLLETGIIEGEEAQTKPLDETSLEPEVD